METKKCGKCGQVLPVSEFYKCSASGDGYQWFCKKCQTSYKLKTAQRVKVKDEAKRPLIASIVGESYKRNPAFAGYQPRELIDELRARGYKGRLYITKEIEL
jgi:hypothetical protein